MDFGEKRNEYSRNLKRDIPVIHHQKYIEAKSKAVDLIEHRQYALKEADFWILMNETKTEKMQYNGLIIGHNGCLKINDYLPIEKRFKPECVKIVTDGYAKSLVFTYCCPEQGIYEVGEVNPSNCKNAYPYAMALKRCMDRVILKNSKIAYSSIYSESESDEFSRQLDDGKTYKNDIIVCPECGGEVKGFKDKRDGSWHTPEQVLIEYGMCCDCVKRKRNAKPAV